MIDQVKNYIWDIFRNIVIASYGSKYLKNKILRNFSTKYFQRINWLIRYLKLKKKIKYKSIDEIRLFK